MKSRESWLKQRKKYLTASDVAAVLGVSTAFKNIIDVFLDKTTEDVEEYDNPILRHGRHMESFTADLYAEQTGREVRNPGATEIAVHPDIPWLGATLDRETLVNGRWIPLEIKQVNDPRYIFMATEWAEEPPEQYWIQCQTQAACKQTDLCSITGQFPGCVLANADMDFDAEFFKLAYPKLDEFWNYNVKKKIPPEVPEHAKALDSFKRLYPKENGWTVTLNDDALQLANDIRILRSEARENEKEARRIEAILRGQIGKASYGALRDGTFLALKTVNRNGYSVEPKSFRQLTRTKRQ